MPGSARDLRFLLALLGSAMPVVGYLRGENYHAFLVSFVIIPVLDWMIGPARAAEPAGERERLERSALFKGVLYAYVPIHVGLVVWGAHVIGSGELVGASAIGFMLSVGVVTGAQGITFAHELGHRRSALDRALARLLLVLVSYGHFYVEHNRGHHVRVATPEDPASARFGETFWAFLPRTVLGSYAHAWRLARGEVLATTLLSLLAAAALGAAFGPCAALFFFVQSAMAVLLLEAVNYIEHYGLSRARLADGRYERVSERHAWDADAWLTNCFLVHLQRHADHHLHPSRPYQALERRAGSPKLPAGYAAMVPLALLPPLWFAVMNPRVPKGAHSL